VVQVIIALSDHAQNQLCLHSFVIGRASLGMRVYAQLHMVTT